MDSKQNIFLDILKVAPIINLEGSDEEQAEDYLSELEGEGELQQRSNHSNGICSKKHDKRIHRIEEEEEEIIAVHASASSLTSDLDMREEPINLTKLKKVLENNKKFKPHQNGRLNANGEVGKEMNTRRTLQQKQKSTALAHQNGNAEDQPTSSSNVEPNKAAGSIRRARFANKSPPIDINQNYLLHGLRYFQTIEGKVSEPLPANYQSVPLTVVSFNVLCQRSMEKTGFLYRHLSGTQFGRWDVRKENLAIEFDRLSADVFCLQEIQDCHYEQCYLPYFQNHGYEGKFTPRNGPDFPDGCALFWRPSKLNILNFREVNYNLRVEGMNRFNVGQIAIFGIIGQETAICISNTHIHYNMNRGDVKLAQIAYLLATMRRVENEFVEKKAWPLYSHFVGHILCGDFNIFPGSPLQRFLATGHINLRMDCKQLALPSANAANTNDLPQQPTISNFAGFSHFNGPTPSVSMPVQRMGISANCTFVGENNRGEQAGAGGNLLNLRTGELRHDFKFASVYEHWNALSEPEVSSYHKDVCQPDYIYYTVADQNDGHNGTGSCAEDKANCSPGVLAYENCIQLRRRLSLPTRVQLDKAGGPLPNGQHGSDHLSLWAEFDVLCLTTKKSQ